MCGCLSCAPLWGPGLQPRNVPWLGMEPVTLWPGVQSTEPHQPGRHLNVLLIVKLTCFQFNILIFKLNFGIFQLSKLSLILDLHFLSVYVINNVHEKVWNLTKSCIISSSYDVCGTSVCNFFKKTKKFLNQNITCNII